VTKNTKNGNQTMSQDRSARFMGISAAALFGFVLVLNALAF
jgi:hypothetical protein